MFTMAGWRWQFGEHPEDGVSAICLHHVHHHNGVSVVMWLGPEEDSAEYEVGENDTFSVEVTDGDGELLYGNAFRSQEKAEAEMIHQLSEQMREIVGE